MLIEDDESIRRGAIDWDAGEDDDSFRFVHSTIWFFRDDNHYQPLATYNECNHRALLLIDALIRSGVGVRGKCDALFPIK